MKKLFYKNTHSHGKFLAFFLLALPFAFTACKKDNKNDRGRFEIEGNPTSWEVPVEGGSTTYQVKASGLWLIDIVDGGDWLKVEPAEGNGDGSFTVTVDKNRTDGKREAALVFRSAFERQDNLLRISQEKNANPPFFQIEDEAAGMEAPGRGAKQTVSVKSNSAWEVKVAGEADWIHLEPASGKGDGKFTIAVDANPVYTARTAQLTFVVDGEVHSVLYTIVQEGKVDETVVLNEDFSWLNYGSAIFYTTTGETRIDSWTDEEKAMGWTSTVNRVSGSGDQPLLYARQGFVKIGKTSYGGDLISPKLKGVAGTQNVTVSFKAVPYQTKGGARDGNVLRINVIGPGTVNVDKFVIDNWPDYDTDPECVEIWKTPGTTRTFTITGATADTQIQFLGDDFDLRSPKDPNKNRIFLDDIIVTIK